MTTFTILMSKNIYRIVERKIGMRTFEYFDKSDYQLYERPESIQGQKNTEKTFSLTHKVFNHKVELFTPVKNGCYIIRDGKLETVYPNCKSKFMLDYPVIENPDKNGLKMIALKGNFQCEYVDKDNFLKRLQEIATRNAKSVVCDAEYFDITDYVNLDDCKRAQDCYITKDGISFIIKDKERLLCINPKF